MIPESDRARLAAVAELPAPSAIEPRSPVPVAAALISEVDGPPTLFPDAAQCLARLIRTDADRRAGGTHTEADAVARTAVGE